MATGGQILVESLRLAGVRHVWGLPGTQTLAVWDAVLGQKDVHPVFLRNEQALSLAAKGYFQVGGGVSAVVTVPGPGATNLITGVLAALTDSSGCLLVTTDVPQEHIGKGCVHECDLKALFASAVKSQEVVSNPDQLADAVLRGIVTARSGRPGPVQIIVSGQLLRAESGTPIPTVADYRRHSTGPVLPTSRALIDEAAELLRQAKRPVIYAGGGVAFARAEQQVQAIARRLGAPVVTSLAGRGVVPDDDPLAVGVPFFPGVGALIAESDAALVVGTRFSEFSTATWSLKLPAALVRIDADPAALQLNYPSPHPLLGDAKDLLDQLTHRLGTGSPADAGWSESAARVRRLQEQTTASILAKKDSYPRVHPMAAIQGIREAVPRDVVVTMDGSATEMWVMDSSFPVHTPRGFVCSEVFQELGAALPLAVGAKVAQAERPVVCITGDGGFMYTMGELSAIVQQRIGVKIVIFDDGHYNSIRQFQNAFFDGRTLGTDLLNPDFRQVAAAFSLPCTFARRNDEVAPRMRELMEQSGPGILVVEIDREPIAPRFQIRISERRTSL